MDNMIIHEQLQKGSNKLTKEQILMLPDLHMSIPDYLMLGFITVLMVLFVWVILLGFGVI